MENHAPTFECRVGVSTGAAWIESPRTKARLTIPVEKRSIFPRIIGRIVQAAGVGRRLVAFTRDELRAVKDAIAPAPVTPAAPDMKPAGSSVYGSWRKRRRF